MTDEHNEFFEQIDMTIEDAWGGLAIVICHGGDSVEFHERRITVRGMNDYIRYDEGKIQFAPTKRNPIPRSVDLGVLYAFVTKKFRFDCRCSSEWSDSDLSELVSVATIVARLGSLTAIARGRMARPQVRLELTRTFGVDVARHIDAYLPVIRGCTSPYGLVIDGHFVLLARCATMTDNFAFCRGCLLRISHKTHRHMFELREFDELIAADNLLRAALRALGFVVSELITTLPADSGRMADLNWAETRFERAQNMGCDL